MTWLMLRVAKYYRENTTSLPKWKRRRC